MKTSRIFAIITLGCLTASLVLAGSALAGQKQAVEATAIYLAAPVPEEVMVTPSGNTHAKGFLATVMMLSEHPFINGLLTWEGASNLDSDNNGGGGGTGILEVGTWEIVAGAPVFKASGGVWRTKWEYRGNPNGPYTVKVMGHGVTGEVQGMQFDFEAQWVAFGVESYVGELLTPGNQ